MNFALGFVIVVVVLSWVYDFYNGANDSANAIATTVSTRVLTPFQSVLLAATLNFAGALFTTEVAKTIGKGIVTEDFMTPIVLISAVLGAILWAAFATHCGIPVSITHCIVGGIVGAGLTAYGVEAINFEKINKVVLGMVISPVGGFVFGFILIIILYWIFKNMHPGKANGVFGKAQLVSASFMAFTHGMNDAQNAMGMITAALLAGGFIGTFEVPTWVMLGSALFMGIGTLYGGKKVIRTMGMKLVKLKTVHGFAAETASAGVILTASAMGIPISTTHVISCAIMGVGSGNRFSAVRWKLVGRIVVAWILTIPISAAVASGVYYVLSRVIA